MLELTLISTSMKIIKQKVSCSSLPVHEVCYSQNDSAIKPRYKSSVFYKSQNVYNKTSDIFPFVCSSCNQEVSTALVTKYDDESDITSLMNKLLCHVL